MKRTHQHEDKAPAIGSSYIPDEPFTKRWHAELRRILDEGGWWVLSAGAQNGKSTGNATFADLYPACKAEDGTTEVPVALTTACPRQGLLYSDLAESLGVNRLMRRQNPTEVIGKALVRCKTRMVVVNNGHELDWQQWEKLLALHEICLKARVAPAWVFSSVGQLVGLPTLPSSDEAIEQLRRRLFYLDVGGHTRSETAEALRLFLNRGPADLLGTDVLKYGGLLFDLLTDEFFDRSRTRRVATVDIDEVAIRIEALFAAGERSGEQLVLRAVEAYRSDRTPGANAA